MTVTGQQLAQQPESCDVAPTPRFADRVQAVQPFFAMEFAKQAAALQARGHHVINLSIGQPDFGAPSAAVTAMHKALSDGQTGYTPAVGIAELRQSIARHYATFYGVPDLEASRVIVTAGASAALLLLTAMLVNVGDEVLVGDPSYPCNRHFLSTFGARVRLVPTTASTRFQLSLALVQQYWRLGTRGVMIGTPSNPTGTSIPAEELAGICGYVREHGGWRIVDEIYLGLQDGGAGQLRARSVLAQDPNAFVVGSFSKYFGMTGWRLGWCIGPREAVEVLERLAQNYYICPSAPAQYGALACFGAEATAECEERRVTLSKRRALVLRGLARIGLSVPVSPDGAFYVYIHISSTGMTAMEFCRRVLEEAHVSLTPGNDFGHFNADQYVRLSYTAPERDLDEALVRLGSFMRRVRQ